MIHDIHQRPILLRERYSTFRRYKKGLLRLVPEDIVGGFAVGIRGAGNKMSPLTVGLVETNDEDLSLISLMDFGLGLSWRKGFVLRLLSAEVAKKGFPPP